MANPESAKIIEKMIIEPMQNHDLTQALIIEGSSYSHPWTKLSFEHELGREVSTCLAAKYNGILVGYLVFWLIRDEIHIINLTLSPEYREIGLAKLLLDYMIEWGRDQNAKKILLEVRASNKRAKHLYQRAGFVMNGRQPNYYQEEKEDALLMARNI